MSVSTRKMYSRFIVISENDSFKAAAELDSSWSKYGVIDTVNVEDKLVVFFSEKKFYVNACEYCEKFDIDHRRCKL